MEEEREPYPAPGCEDGRIRILTVLEEETHGLSISDISRKIDLNRNSVAKYLNMLVIAGRVEMQVVGSARVYRLAHRLPVSAIFPFLPDAAVTIGSDFRVRRANAHFCNLFDLDETAVAGSDVSKASCAILRLLGTSDRLGEAMRGERDDQNTWHLLEGEGCAYFVWTVPVVFEDQDYGAVAVIRPV
ncbi:winged helix-turn-helix domain-containing protein [Methanofollis formosanus]|nr:winged helix-turn-helix domain-containing protein [Methanofollis formosanus]